MKNQCTFCKMFYGARACACALFEYHNDMNGNYKNARPTAGLGGVHGTNVNGVVYQPFLVL